VAQSLAALLVLGTGCDLGPRADESSEGPSLRLVSTDPPDKAGLDCDSTDSACGVPTNVTLTLRFDRFLRPDTAIRQSISLFTGDRGNPVPPPSSTRPELVPEYDPLERSVRYRLPPGFNLQPNALYTLEVLIASDLQPFGFRAFDAAPLAGERALRLSFMTSSGPEPSGAAPEAPDCDEMLDLLAPCGDSGCHGTSEPNVPPGMGLGLDTWEAIRSTALGMPAHQTEIGATTGRTAQAPVRFGVNMPVIDPGRPDNSYLIYKLLLSPGAYLPAPGGECPDDARCEAPDPAELARLVDWFVLGEAMPKGSANVVHHGDVSRMQAFIREGRGCWDE
jgi:hypothetical protein